MNDWQPEYSKWRHGGWYVHNVRYPSGAIGCVSNNYEDGKWRIACGNLHGITFSSRADAAKAEYVAVEMLKKYLAECAEAVANVREQLASEVLK